MKKEIVQHALEHRRTGIVPHHYSLTQGARRKLIDYYGEAYKDEIGNYLSIYFLDRPGEWEWVRPDVIQDMWGVHWDRSIDKDIGVPISLRFPEPDMKYWDPPPIHPGLFEPIRGFIRENQDTFTIVCLSFFTLYDRAWTLRGIENLLADPTRPIVEAELEITSLHGLFSGNGGTIFKRGELAIETIVLNREEAGLLNAPEMLPAFRLEHTFFDFSDKPVSWGRFICRGDRFRFTATVGFSAE